MTVFLSNKTLKAAAGPHASLGESLTVYRANGSLSGGTLASVLAMAENVPLQKLREANADYAFCPGELVRVAISYTRGLKAHLAARGKSGPKEKLWYKIPFSEPPRYAMHWFMAAGNRAIVQRSWALNAVATSAKDSVQIARAQYGPEFTYDECLEKWPAAGFLGWLSVTSASVAFLVVSALLLLAPPVSYASGVLTALSHRLLTALDSSDG